MRKLLTLSVAPLVSARAGMKWRASKMMKRLIAFLLCAALCCVQQDSRAAGWLPLVKAAGGGATTTLNPSDKAAAVTLSGGNLVMTNTGAGMARSVASHSTGKYYFEMVPTVTFNTYDHAVGLATASASLTAFPGSPDTNSLSWAYSDTGMAIAGGAGTAPGVTYNTLGDVACVAVDLGAKLIWFRANGGNWNNNVANDPATGVGGISIAALPAGPYFAYGYNTSNTGVNTMNFGASFSFTAPSGFGSW